MGVPPRLTPQSHPPTHKQTNNCRNLPRHSAATKLARAAHRFDEMRAKDALRDKRGGGAPTTPAAALPAGKQQQRDLKAFFLFSSS